MYTGELIKQLMEEAESLLNRKLPTTQDPFDNLCSAKNALADKMAQEIHDYGKESQESRDLWYAATLLQEKVIKE